MKKRFLSVALLALLGVGCFSFAACDLPEDDSITGNEDTTYSVTITNKEELQKSWPLGEPNRSLNIDLEPVANPASEVAAGNLAVTSSDPDVVAATGLSLTALSTGSATITATWNGASDSVDVAVVANTYDYSIADVNAGLRAGTIKDGDTVSFYGQVVASMEPSTTHMYSGIYLGDGDEALMLYSGQVDNYFFAEDGSLAINYGDNIGVSATVSAYNGFYEFKPTYIEPLDSSITITTPTPKEMTETDWNSLTYTDVGRLAKMELTYVSGTVSTEASTHSTIICKIGNTNVNYYVNYHNGTEQIEALAAKINTLEEGDTFTSYGVIGWYNGPELCPNFMLVNGEVLKPSECVTVPEKTAPTAITITGSNSVEQWKTTQLSVSVTPTDASASVSWASTNEKILSVDSHGLVTGNSVGTASVTATSLIDPNVSGSFEITVTATTRSFTTQKTGKLGVYQENKGAYYYFDGTKNGNFGNMTTSWNDAVTVSLLKENSVSDNYYYLQFTTADNDTLFFGHTDASNSQVVLSYAPYPVQIDSEYGAFLNTDGTRFLGTYSTYETLSWSDAEQYLGNSGQFIAKIYESESEAPVVEPNAPVGAYTQVDTPVSGSTYYLGFPSSELMYLFNGTTDNYSDYLLCTNKASEAVEIKVTQNADNTTYGLTFTKNATEYTIYAWPSSSTKDGNTTQYGEITFIETANLTSAKDNAVTAFSWDSSKSTFTVTLTNGSWYFSTYANNSAISLTATSNNYAASHLYTYDSEYEEPEVNLELATSLTSGSEYYLAYKAGDTYYYFDGSKVGSSDYYLGAATSIESAVKVTVTGDNTNGWTITFNGNTLEAWSNYNSNNSTYYGEITYFSGSSTHNGVTTFAWNSTYNTVTVDLAHASGTTTTYYLEYNNYNGTHEIQLNGISYIGSAGQAFQFFTEVA